MERPSSAGSSLVVSTSQTGFSWKAAPRLFGTATQLMPSGVCLSDSNQIISNTVVCLDDCYYKKWLTRRIRPLRGCSGLGLKATVTILVSNGTRRPNGSIGTSRVTLVGKEAG